jgi:hypothetical protein
MHTEQPPHKINICVRLPPRLRDELRREAMAEETTFGEYIRAILQARRHHQDDPA